MIIFDESISSLDIKTETKLLDAFDSLIKNKTVITIAHRASSIARAERVIDYKYDIILFIFKLFKEL